jgi:hypothetical protein
MTEKTFFKQETNEGYVRIRVKQDESNTAGKTGGLFL